MDVNNLFFYGQKNGVEVTISEPKVPLRNIPIKYRVTVKSLGGKGTIYMDYQGHYHRARTSPNRRLVDMIEWREIYWDVLNEIVPSYVLKMVFPVQIDVSSIDHVVKDHEMQAYNI